MCLCSSASPQHKAHCSRSLFTVNITFFLHTSGSGPYQFSHIHAQAPPIQLQSYATFRNRFPSSASTQHINFFIAPSGINNFLRAFFCFSIFFRELIYNFFHSALIFFLCMIVIPIRVAGQYLHRGEIDGGSNAGCPRDIYIVIFSDHTAAKAHFRTRVVCVKIVISAPQNPQCQLLRTA